MIPIKSNYGVPFWRKTSGSQDPELPLGYYLGSVPQRFHSALWVPTPPQPRWVPGSVLSGRNRKSRAENNTEGQFSTSEKLAKLVDTSSEFRQKGLRTGHTVRHGAGILVRSQLITLQGSSVWQG